MTGNNLPPNLRTMAGAFSARATITSSASWRHESCTSLLPNTCPSSSKTYSAVIAMYSTYSRWHHVGSLQTGSTIMVSHILTGQYLTLIIKVSRCSTCGRMNLGAFSTMSIMLFRSESSSWATTLSSTPCMSETTVVDYKKLHKKHQPESGLVWKSSFCAVTFLR